jgi:hypothetical protein
VGSVVMKRIGTKTYFIAARDGRRNAFTGEAGIDVRAFAEEWARK